MKKSKPDPTVVGERIKRIRESMQLSMDDFASRIDNNAKSGTVNNWESGKNLPNKKRLKKIAELGSISVEELLYGETIEERNLYQYLTSFVYWHFEYSKDRLMNEYQFSEKEIETLLNQSLKLVDTKYENVSIKESNSEEYLIQRGIASTALINKIKKILEIHSLKGNPNQNIYTSVMFNLSDVEYDLHSYLEYLTKNNLNYNIKFAEEVKDVIATAQKSLIKSNKKYNK